MKTKFFMFLFVFSLIFLYSCNSNQQQIQEAEIRQVKIVATCDDDNPCTEDRFNQLTQKCDYKTLENCCGDKVCSSNERCNPETYKTICQKDCPLDCPVKIIIEEWNCEGNCIKENEVFKITGDSKITASVSNVGEKGANDVTNSFKCYKENGNPFTSTTGSNERSGVSFKTYFTNMQNKVYLSGTPYGKDTTTYYLELTGVPTENLLINCDITILDLGSTTPSQVKIQLSAN